MLYSDSLWDPSLTSQITPITHPLFKQWLTLDLLQAPYYPAPPGGWVSSWVAAYAKAQVVVANMTLAEKVNLTTGTGELMGPCVGNTGSALRFGIPNLCLQDSALGIAATDSR